MAKRCLNFARPAIWPFSKGGWMANRDEAVRGLTTAHVSPMRYKSRSANPHEGSGLLMSMIPKGARILDIGCGTGSVSSMIRDLRDAEVIGIEPHPERAREAKASRLSAGATHGKFLKSSASSTSCCWRMFSSIWSTRSICWKRSNQR
jgi:SAM-dependent methyltransferase